MARQKTKATSGRRKRGETKGERWQMRWEKVKVRLPIAIFSVLALALPHLTGTNDSLLSSLVLATILVMGAVKLAWLIWCCRPLSLTFPETILLAFVLWQWLTVFVSVYRWASLLEASRWTAFAVVLASIRHLSDEKQRFWVAVAFVGAATLTALYGLREYALNAAMGNWGWRIFGPFLQPNLFGNFLMLAFFVALGVAFQRPKGWTFLSAFATTLLLVAMVLTGSKGALIAWLAGSVAFGAIAVAGSASEQTRKRLWLALGIGLAVLLAVVALMPPIRLRFETIWTAQAHSWVFRIFVWKAALVGALTKPILGFGAGTFEWAYPQFTTVGFTRHAHNGFLQVAIESGFVGLTILLSFFATLIFTRTTHPPNHPPSHQPLRWGCIAGIIAFCLHNLVETAWMTLANSVALAIVCGIFSSTLQTRWRIQRQWQFILLIPILVGLWHSVSVSRGAYSAKKAQSEVLPSSRLYWLELASNFDPLNARHRIDRAILLEAWSKATKDEFRLKQALRLCDEAIQLQPTRSGNYKVKARILRELGEIREAERALRLALKFNRTDTEAFLKLGELLEEQGRGIEAVQFYRRLVELDQRAYSRYKPVDQWQDIFIAAGKIRLAKHLLEQGKQTEAEKFLNEAEKMLKSFLDAYLPILKASEPEAAESQKAFVETLLDEIDDARSKILGR